MEFTCKFDYTWPIKYYVLVFYMYDVQRKPWSLLQIYYTSLLNYTLRSVLKINMFNNFKQ